jgi:hypothetical protein
MTEDFGFFKTEMPFYREADYHLGCLDSSVYIDFNESKEGLITLCRISFDCFGCCNIGDAAKPLNAEMSRQFIEEIQKDILDQKILTCIIKEIIKINKEFIWKEALEEYNLLAK